MGGPRTLPAPQKAIAAKDAVLRVALGPALARPGGRPYEKAQAWSRGSQDLLWKQILNLRLNVANTFQRAPGGVGKQLGTGFFLRLTYSNTGY